MEIMERKYFFVWSMKKEKKYLEDMAKKGYILSNVKIFKYYFKKAEAVDYVYEFDFQIMSKKNEKEYLEFFEDWELIIRRGAWFYFRRLRTNSKKDSIYIDNESKSNMYKRIFIFLALTGFPMYYQLLVMYPNIDISQSTLPNFYGFFKYVLYIIAPLHLLVVIRVLTMYLKYKKSIKE